MEIVQVSPPPVFYSKKVGIDALPKGIRVRVLSDGSLSMDIRATEISIIPSGLKGIQTIFCRPNQIEAVARSYKGKITEVYRMGSEIVRRTLDQERMDSAYDAFERALHYNPVFQKMSYVVTSSLLGGQRVETRVPTDLSFIYDKAHQKVTLNASKTVLKKDPTTGEAPAVDGVDQIIMPNSKTRRKNISGEKQFAYKYGRRHVPEEPGAAKYAYLACNRVRISP